MEHAAVLLTGATGLIGRRLVTRLLKSGDPLRALSRNPSRAALPSAVEVLEWDGTTVPAQALAGTRAVVHLAGEPVFGGRLTAERKRRIRDSRVASTLGIAQTIAELPEAERPGALVCASAVGYYGSRGDDVLEEGEPPGEGFLARVCVEWEEAARRVEDSGVRSVSVRIGIVLAAEGGALQPMLLPFKAGLGPRLGDGRQWFPWVHADDVVGIFEAAIRSEDYRGPVNATSPNPVTNADFTYSLAAALGRPTFLRVPAALLRLAGDEIADELLGSRRVIPRAATDRGFAFAYPLIESALESEV